jgi:hypothetical protein
MDARKLDGIDASMEISAQIIITVTSTFDPQTYTLAAETTEDS